MGSRHWDMSPVKLYSQRTAYKGLTISWRYDKVGRLKPEAEWLSLPEDVASARVDRDLWEATQKQRASNTGEVLAITVVADGRDWRVSGSMPRNEQAGILSQSS